MQCFAPLVSFALRAGLVACAVGACTQPSVRERECEQVRKVRAPRRTYDYSARSKDPLFDRDWQDPEIRRAVERLRNGGSDCVTLKPTTTGDGIIQCQQTLNELCGIKTLQ
jgi:hypothetical protein